MPNSPLELTLVWVLFGVFGFGVVGLLFFCMLALFALEIWTFISLCSLLTVTCSVSWCRTEFKMRFDVVYMVWMRIPSGFLFFSRTMSSRFVRTLPKIFTVLAASHRIRNELQAQVLTISVFTWPQNGIGARLGRFLGSGAWLAYS